MGMFERLGEKVERFKQEAVAASEESAAYRCRDCGESIYSDQETCPECGSAEIARVETDDEDEGPDGDPNATDAAERAGTDPDPETDAE